jgi:hypothetical protein
VTATGSVSAVGSIAAQQIAYVSGVGVVTASGHIGDMGEPARNPRARVTASKGRVAVQPYAGTTRVTRRAGTVTVEDS